MESEGYEFVGHRWCKPRWSPYQICDSCGLVGTNNDLAMAANRLGCDHRYHPTWKSLVHRFTKHNGQPTILG